MYFTVKHIDIKLHQDYADFLIDDRRKILLLCDGIGEFSNSGQVAKAIVEQFLKKKYTKLSELLYDEEVIRLKEQGIIGGTTIISAINNNNSKKVTIEFLGNGGIVHCYGDFAHNVNSNEPYRYGELMIPHVSPNGALTKHISHNSQKPELSSSSIELNLNYLTGDIVLLFSDGISSLEDKVIIEDNNNRFWRSENATIQFILKELNRFLKTNNNIESFQENLIKFNQDVLETLKAENYLSDDASLGIIITKKVLRYYGDKMYD